jgi:hypothetical protein
MTVCRHDLNPRRTRGGDVHHEQAPRVQQWTGAAGHSQPAAKVNAREGSVDGPSPPPVRPGG